MTTFTMTHEEMDREVDLAVAGSFPASDPPPWTLGATPSATPVPGWHSPAAIAPAAIDLVIAAGRGRRRTASIIEAMLMTAMIPFAILAAAAPLLLAAWGIDVAAAWLLGGR
jgi:hypothetical protein